MHEAVFIVTNKGSVPIELSLEIRPENYACDNGVRVLRHGFCWPVPVGVAPVLMPGEMARVIGAGSLTDSWTAEIAYKESSAAWGLELWMRSKAGPRTSRILDRIFSRRAIRWAAFESHASRYSPAISRGFGVDFSAPSPPFVQVDFRFNPSDAFDPVNHPKDWRPHITEPPPGLLNPATYRE
jgi:hypothetical protein